MPRCLDCFYPLSGLESNRCPECSRPFDLSNPSTFTTKPPFVWWTFWWPGSLLAIVGGLITGTALILMGNWGMAIWIALPFSCGIILGYRVRSRLILLIILGIALQGILICGLMGMGLGGLYCGAVLAGLSLGPIFIGTAGGAALRSILKATNFSQRAHLPIWLVFLLPLLWGLVEGPPSPSAPVQTVTTARIVNYPVNLCWSSLMFYEDVQHKAPWIIRNGLATPTSSKGGITGVGSTRTCVYTTGRLVKQVTRYDAPSRLDFDVIEQAGVYEHDAQLIGGSFIFTAIDENTTRITLTTTYRPRLTPRFAWRPFEHYAVHGLHDHVLEGIEIKAARESGDPLGRTGDHHEDHGG